ncbi:MAG: hypothetical protein HC915_08920 [Anaerolineae bacterium]|nr:hypothetical protein [Anaerolineae bacterium]
MDKTDKMSTIAAKKRKTKRRKFQHISSTKWMKVNPFIIAAIKRYWLKRKTPEQIMGSSALQAMLVGLVMKQLFKTLTDDHIILSGEAGLKFIDKSWRNLDIAIYDKRKVEDKSAFLINKYIEIIPEIVIEIDTKAPNRRGRASCDTLFLS